MFKISRKRTGFCVYIPTKAIVITITDRFLTFIEKIFDKIIIAYRLSNYRILKSWNLHVYENFELFILYSLFTLHSNAEFFNLISKVLILPNCCFFFWKVYILNEFFFKETKISVIYSKAFIKKFIDLEKVHCRL